MDRYSRKTPDWRDASEYAFTSELGGAQWAWEFLRRNVDYRREWQAFWSTWQELEAAYGRPPDRDFCAWKRDPRAWVRVSEETGGECLVDVDKVLIECAFGAKWGFHKFPPDPADNDPVGGGRLNWREPDERLEPLGPDDQDWLGAEPARVALGFDLARPLAGQLERAKRLLQGLQHGRVRRGTVKRLTVSGETARWRLLLRLWDADAAGAEDSVIAATLGVADVAPLRAEAGELVNAGYRKIAHLK